MSQLYCEDGFNAVFVSPGVEYWFKTLKVFDLFGQSIEEIHTVVLKVVMSCEGCSGAVKRVLTKMEGVESFDIDMKEQKVTVKGNVQPDAVLQTVSKTGKKTSFWEAAEAPAAAAETKAA
ncbi:unnamed protein product [Linum tenue]|uniref:HMA domain-containing protein n=1 Tax=Linum tenue TaxID=586396 RepID=A0AAV0M8P4_9ROSI|nr:unnamed protein product [Linum tenue]